MDTLLFLTDEIIVRTCVLVCVCIIFRVYQPGYTPMHMFMCGYVNVPMCALVSSVPLSFLVSCRIMAYRAVLCFVLLYCDVLCCVVLRKSKRSNTAPAVGMPKKQETFVIYEFLQLQRLHCLTFVPYRNMVMLLRFGT